MGEAVDTIPSILNKCLFVSPDIRTDRRPGKNNMSLNLEGGRHNYTHAGQNNCNSGLDLAHLKR